MIFLVGVERSVRGKSSKGKPLLALKIGGGDLWGKPSQGMSIRSPPKGERRERGTIRGAKAERVPLYWGEKGKGNSRTVFLKEIF